MNKKYDRKKNICTCLLWSFRNVLIHFDFFFRCILYFSYWIWIYVWGFARHKKSAHGYTSDNRQHDDSLSACDLCSRNRKKNTDSVTISPMNWQPRFILTIPLPDTPRNVSIFIQVVNCSSSSGSHNYCPQQSSVPTREIFLQTK